MMMMVRMKCFTPIKLRGVQLPTLLIMHGRWLDGGNDNT